METWPVINLTLPGAFFGGATPPARVQYQGELYSVISWNETMTDADWQVHLSLMKPEDIKDQTAAFQAYAASVMREVLSRSMQLP